MLKSGYYINRKCWLTLPPHLFLILEDFHWPGMSYDKRQNLTQVTFFSGWKVILRWYGSTWVCYGAFRVNLSPIKIPPQTLKGKRGPLGSTSVSRDRKIILLMSIENPSNLFTLPDYRKYSINSLWKIPGQNLKDLFLHFAGHLLNFSPKFQQNLCMNLSRIFSVLLHWNCIFSWWKNNWFMDSS